MIDLHFSRREVLRSSVGLAGLTVPTFLQARARASARVDSRPSSGGRAKSCIVIYCWGGIGHQESFDPKPEAPKELRGEFGAIETKTPGIRFCEHLPLLAKHSEKLAIIRSVHHTAGAHSGGIYYSLTGHAPTGGRAKDRNNWPSLTSMISRFQEPGAGTPRAIRLPYSMYDNGALMPGEYGGWLGPAYDPVLISTPAGRPFGGTSRTGGRLNLKLSLEKQRVAARRSLLEELERPVQLQYTRAASPTGAGSAKIAEFNGLDRFRTMAADLLLDSALSEAYDLENEDSRVRALYGDHVGGQSLLLARRLVEVGVPVVQVCAGAGDLAGGSGDNWDTHRDHFPKMKRRLLPVFDRSVSALLTDLEMRGLLEETLVVLLTDFGRTPKINGNGGRDHYPAVYSLFLAGGGIRGGQAYGSSDRNGAAPHTRPTTPGDVHATCYKALGIDHRAELHDRLGRPFRICEGEPLPLF